MKREYGIWRRDACDRCGNEFQVTRTEARVYEDGEEVVCSDCRIYEDAEKQGADEITTLRARVAELETLRGYNVQLKDSLTDAIESRKQYIDRARKAEAEVERMKAERDALRTAIETVPHRVCVGRAPATEGTDWSERHGPLGTVCDNCNRYVMGESLGESLDRFGFACFECANGCHWAPCATDEARAQVSDLEHDAARAEVERLKRRSRQRAGIIRELRDYADDLREAAIESYKASHTSEIDTLRARVAELKKLNAALVRIQDDVIRRAEKAEAEVKPTRLVNVAALRARVAELERQCEIARGQVIEYYAEARSGAGFDVVRAQAGDIKRAVERGSPAPLISGACQLLIDYATVRITAAQGRVAVGCDRIAKLESERDRLVEVVREQADMVNKWLYIPAMLRGVERALRAALEES